MMPKKSSRKRKPATPSGTLSARTSLPHDLDQRLQVVWQELGHLIDWCESSADWTQLFCAEARPYRETFHWEAVARMISAYLAEHQSVSPEDALTDCLIATQCPPCSDDRDTLTEFHHMWQEILIDSQQEIDTLMQRDLELAQQEGTHEIVVALYAANHQMWRQG